MANILVTGGAGYIGSVVTKRLLERKHNVLVLDNLSTGHRESVTADLVVCDLAHDRGVDEIFATRKLDGVIHFASHAYVGESVTNPRKYYEDNLGNGMRLLAACVRYNVRGFVFSSSCATYGTPIRVPIDEAHPQNPINPYGETKLFIEKMLAAYDRAYGLRYAALRYFNAAGASLDGTLGESHDPETHLIPLALDAAKGGKQLNVFGTDYETRDGTCVRDYIHIEDLATAHITALERLIDGGSSEAINLGTGHGITVREMIQTVERITGKQVPHTMGPRRAGDPPALVAAADKAREVLGWVPKHSDPETILTTAWRWAQAPRY